MNAAGGILLQSTRHLWSICEGESSWSSTKIVYFDEIRIRTYSRPALHAMAKCQLTQSLVFLTRSLSSLPSFSWLSFRLSQSSLKISAASRLYARLSSIIISSQTPSCYASNSNVGKTVALSNGMDTMRVLRWTSNAQRKLEQFYIYSPTCRSLSISFASIFNSA